MRYIQLTKNLIHKKKHFKSCDYDLKYNFKSNDSLVLNNYDFETLKVELNISGNKLYNKIKMYDSYNIHKWSMKKVIEKNSFFVTMYSSENINVLKFSIKVYYLNSKILQNNILINKDPEDFIYVIVPVNDIID